MRVDKIVEYHLSSTGVRISPSWSTLLATKAHRIVQALPPRTLTATPPHKARGVVECVGVETARARPQRRRPSVRPPATRQCILR